MAGQLGQIALLMPKWMMQVKARRLGYSSISRQLETRERRGEKRETHGA